MKDAYVKSSDNSVDTIWGIEFSDNKFPFEYKLYHKWDDVLFDNNKVKLMSNGNECRLNTSNIISPYYYSCAGNKLVYYGF